MYACVRSRGGPGGGRRAGGLEGTCRSADLGARTALGGLLLCRRGGLPEACALVTHRGAGTLGLAGIAVRLAVLATHRLVDLCRGQISGGSKKSPGDQWWAAALAGPGTGMGMRIRKAVVMARGRAGGKAF